MDIISLATSFYLGQIGGKLSGMNNIELKPKAIIGIREKMKTGKVLHDIDICALYGNAKTGDGINTGKPLELRANWTALYPLYKNYAESFNAGLYTSFALPFHNYTPYISPGAYAYSAEENEVIKKELLLGVDFNFKYTYDKIDSSLHNIIFFQGKKIAPNLLAYKPLYGFDWRNSFFLLGNTDNPRLKLSTNIQFWFARKAGVALFNAHDGLGGTKREFDYDIRLHYFFNKKFQTYVTAYGYNNLNRGASTKEPYGFKDGFGVGIEYKY